MCSTSSQIRHHNFLERSLIEIAFWKREPFIFRWLTSTVNILKIVRGLFFALREGLLSYRQVLNSAISNGILNAIYANDFFGLTVRFSAVMIGTFWKRKSRPIWWHKARLLTRQFFSTWTSIVYEDVPVTNLGFLLELRELLWPPRERAKSYSLTRWSIVYALISVYVTVPSEPLTLDLMETYNFIFRRACYCRTSYHWKRKRRIVLENFRFARLVPFLVHLFFLFLFFKGASILQEKVQSYWLLPYRERKRKTPRLASSVRVRALVEPGTDIRRSAHHIQ